MVGNRRDLGIPQADLHFRARSRPATRGSCSDECISRAEKAKNGLILAGHEFQVAGARRARRGFPRHLAAAREDSVFLDDFVSGTGTPLVDHEFRATARVCLRVVTLNA